jgi:hypothetical protein
MWALYLGLIPEAALPAALGVVRAAIAANGSHLWTGAFATSYMYRGGPGWNLSSAIYDALALNDYPGYGWMLANNATCVWEWWSTGWAETSWCHAWLGSVSAFFHRFAGGISHAPGAVGFDDVWIRPYPPAPGSSAAVPQVAGREPHPSAGVPRLPGGPRGTVDAPVLPWANTTYDSARGMVAAAWWYEPAAGGAPGAAASFNLSITLPPNVRATAWLPLPPDVVAPAFTTCAGAGAPQMDGQGYAGFDVSYLPACDLSVAWQA